MEAERSCWDLTGDREVTLQGNYKTHLPQSCVTAADIDIDKRSAFTDDELSWIPEVGLYDQEFDEVLNLNVSDHSTADTVLLLLSSKLISTSTLLRSNIKLMDVCQKEPANYHIMFVFFFFFWNQDCRFSAVENKQFIFYPNNLHDNINHLFNLNSTLTSTKLLDLCYILCWVVSFIQGNLVFSSCHL